MRHKARYANDEFVMRSTSCRGGHPYRDDTQNKLRPSCVNEPDSGSLKPCSDNGLRCHRSERSPELTSDNNRNIVGLLKLSTQNVVCLQHRHGSRFSFRYFEKKPKLAAVRPTSQQEKLPPRTVRKVSPNGGIPRAESAQDNPLIDSCSDSASSTTIRYFPMWQIRKFASAPRRIPSRIRSVVAFLFLVSR